ncbi:MAG TPA: prolyl oligopeptidase family serine peptidase [Steroidobacteraceae bacterium]|nr:prolyl oligopeptidase family serine peptidase [Steroidobacteraceae bacterium]
MRVVAICAALALGTSASAVPAPPVTAFALVSGIASARLSPDGRLIVYVAETLQGHEARVRELESGRETVVLDSAPGKFRLRWCDFSGPGRVICGTASLGQVRGVPHERTGLVAVDIDGKARRTLMQDSADPVRDRIVDLVDDDAGVVLVQHDETGAGFPEVSRLDTRSGTLRPVVRGRSPVRQWLSDGRGLVRLGIGYEDGFGSIYARAAEGDEWDLIARHRLDDPSAWAPLEFGENPGDLYALKLHDGRYALFHVDLNRGGVLSLMFSHPEFDVIGPVLLEPHSRDLLAVRYVTDRVREHFFDAAEQQLEQRLDAVLPDRVNLIVDRSRDGERALVWSYADSWPGSLHLFETRSGRISDIGRQYPELDPSGLGRTIALAYHARDGQLIPAYLTVPRDRVPQGLPAVLMPHGGPEARVEWGFDPLVQLLATRGFAVLQMNFRGSAGFGAGFLAAGTAEWSGVVHQDITDGATWLVRQGIADPERVCIVGSSFGGYAALLGLVREPATYRCAVSQAGIADLNALVAGKERFQYAEFWQARIGDDPVVRTRSSPVTAAALAEDPVLLVHGTEDVVVPPAQSRIMAEALEQHDKPHQLEILPGCDHDFATASCRLRYYQLVDDFLRRQLGTPDD